MKAFAVGRGLRSTFRTVVVSLLMLASPLVPAAPGHAGLEPHRHAAIPHEQVLLDSRDDALAVVADPEREHEHEQDRCPGPGLLDDGACCSVAQCATMHGGLLVTAAEAFVPRLDTSTHWPALAMPEGIGIGPALRPPCPTI